MIRRFYTDPLAAAWMSKHHGFQFNQIMNKDGFGQLSMSDGGAFEKRYIEQLDYPNAHRLYIHPDSLFLLAPQQGDLIQSGESLCRFGRGLITFDGFHVDEQSRIIQRNDIAFVWPESEAA